MSNNERYHSILTMPSGELQMACALPHVIAALVRLEPDVGGSAYILAQKINSSQVQVMSGRKLDSKLVERILKELLKAGAVTKHPVILDHFVLVPQSNFMRVWEASMTLPFQEFGVEFRVLSK